MASYRTWDIVVAPFPFTDSPSQQGAPCRRGVNRRFEPPQRQVCACHGTSAANAAHYGDVAIKDLRTAGLPAASVVRPSKLAVVEEADVLKRVGTLAHADRVRVAKQLREYLAVGD